MLIEPPYTACPELDSGRPAWFTLSEADALRWCERRTSSLTSGEAVYSIRLRFFLWPSIALNKVAEQKGLGKMQP